MQPSNLPTVWGAPDNSRLTSKQISFRLPVHVAAKIAALCEIYPNRSRTEIVGDLLASALEAVELGFPAGKGKQCGIDPDTNEGIFEDVGPRARYYSVTNRHYMEFERELGNEKPSPFFSGGAVVFESELK
jgi:hypothetical protein